MSNMRSHSVRHVQHHLAAVLADVERGEEIEVLRRGRPVARIVPLPSESQPCDWSDAARRLQSVYPTLPGGTSAARIIADGRGER
jgi:prevent-host-death family protein